MVPANDNDEDCLDCACDLVECDSDASLDLLLMTAGYDPSFIREDRRRLALSIAELWADGVRSRRDVEEALDDDSTAVRDTVKALRRAARGRAQCW
jgi:hypothetical protein